MWNKSFVKHNNQTQAEKAFQKITIETNMAERYLKNNRSLVRYEIKKQVNVFTRLHNKFKNCV